MKGSSSPPPGSSTEPQGFGVEEPTSDAEISVTIDPDEIAAFSREAATATRVDEEIDTRAKRSVLVGSDRPPALESSAPEQGYGSSSRPSRFVDRYELIGLLGVGGMGSVYRVRDLILQEEVALKILRKDLAEVASAVERFRSEVRLTRRITHPNVVRIHDIGEHRGEHFYTMECIVGDPLSAAMGKGAAMDVVRAYEYGVQIAEGLAAVHQANVVHRDLKPDNLMVSREGRVVITDFGVAVLRDGPSVDVLPLRGGGHASIHGA